jgi:hypothetical protein
MQLERDNHYQQSANGQSEFFINVKITISVVAGRRACAVPRAAASRQTHETRATPNR